MQTVLVLQHVGCETLGSIGTALDARGIGIEYVRSYAGDPIPPDIGDYAGLIVLGGPMSVVDHSRYPFLAQELRLIDQALSAEKPVLGICLGSQLLATALGADVTRCRRKEIGWHPLHLMPVAQYDTLFRGVTCPIMGFHWHGDEFSLPPGAVSLAYSELTECQAFRYGKNAFGLLCHLEVNEQMVREMCAEFVDELREVGIDASQIAEGHLEHLSSLERLGLQVFRNWASYT